jgi:hypothetical protein
LVEEEEDTRDPRRVAEERELLERENEKPPLPPWQAVSGLGDAESERNMSPKRRDAAIKTLLNVVIMLAEKELAAQSENPRPERTHLWDPLPQICFYLGIARAKLSRYAKELTGMAAHEVLDKVRARWVKEALKCQIQNAKFKSGTALEIYKELKEARRCPSWSRETFAMDLGFANYRRFYRACLLYYRKTPGQLEFEIISEACENGDLAQSREEAKNGEDKEKNEVQFFTRSGVENIKGVPEVNMGENRAAG